VSEGTRTPDRLDHNQELYQLSYAHRGSLAMLPAGVAKRLPECRDRPCDGQLRLEAVVLAIAPRRTS
jgi:hypothetical protein